MAACYRISAPLRSTAPGLCRVRVNRSDIALCLRLCLFAAAADFQAKQHTSSWGKKKKKPLGSRRRRSVFALEIKRLFKFSGRQPNCGNVYQSASRGALISLSNYENRAVAKLWSRGRVKPERMTQTHFRYVFHNKSLIE